jgi:hypothetical protein
MIESIARIRLVLDLSGIGSKPFAALDDVPGSLPDLFVYSPDVLAQNADANQLNTAKKQHHYYDGRITKRERVPENSESRVQNTDAKCRDGHDKAGQRTQC